MNQSPPLSYPAVPDASALYQAMREHIGAQLTPNTCLLGIHSGGAWVTGQLARDLGLQDRVGSISSSMYRDDYARRGLADSAPTDIPFEVEGKHIIIVDDVLYTGRTMRAVLNELFDYGRPEKVELMVLVDRGGRQLPFAASYAALTMSLPAAQKLHLARDAQGQFHFTLAVQE